MTNDNSTDTHGDLGSVLFVCLWIFKKQSVGQIRQMPCLFGNMDQIQQIAVLIPKCILDAVVIQTELRKMDGFSGTVIQPQNAEDCVVAEGQNFVCCAVFVWNTVDIIMYRITVVV